MPLSIRDGNSSLTTLSTIVVSSAHIPAHTVVSLGAQAITDIAGAVSGVELGANTLNALENIHVSISAGSSITVGNVVSVTGGLTDAELRASSVTIGGSVSVSNFPATQAVTFGQASVTFGISTITGSVSVLNLPATQSVTFTQASVTFSQAGVTFGTAVITGSTSIIGTPSVTFGQAVVSASNIGNLNDSVGTDDGTPTSTKFIKIGGHQDGQNQVEHIVHVSAGGAMKVDASDSSVTFGLASVTFSAVSISNFPSTQTIAGTVTANIDNFQIIASDSGGNAPILGIQLGYSAGEEDYRHVDLTNPLPISGTVTANAVGLDYDGTRRDLPVLYREQAGSIGSTFVVPIVPLTGSGGLPVSENNPLISKIAGITGRSSTMAGNAVTALPVVLAQPVSGFETQTISGTVTVGAMPNGVTANIPAVGEASDSMATSDSANTGIVSLTKRLSTHLAVLRDELGGGSNAVSGFNSIGSRSDSAPANASDNGSLIAFTKRLNSAIDTIFGSSFLSLNNSQATFRISHPYGTLGIASPSYIVTANTAQLVFSAKSTSSPRRFLFLQNTSDTPMYVGFGTGLYAKPAASGAVNAVTITNGGSGYGAAPSVTFSAPPAGGTTAAGTAVISGGVVTSIVITDAGSGYTTAPTITFSTGAATATAIIGQNGLYLAPTFGSLSFDRGFIPNDAIYIVCGTQGKSFVAMQA